MFNIRIKKSPSNKHTGDQDDYSLVRNLAALQSNNTEASVNDKIGAVPRSQATLEAEGGESVFGDVNRDGNMELMHFVGKRHSEGGIPADIPEGSFIFSDTKSLVIKDKEVIEKIFGLPFRKQGYTPAEISKKFDINKYIQILKSETEDELSKRTAAEMLRSNKDKLGILAFIQESMKGFPDGIPTIAEEVMTKMGVNPEQLMQEAQPQEGQVQEEGNPMEGMSPEEQEMMMQMMQQENGAPMEDGMPMQKYGGLTQMKKGGNNVYQALQLQKSGYNADPLVNNQVQTKVPGVNMDPFIYNADDRNTYDSLRKNPVQGFENSGFEQGKIYTFKSRPGTYYKIGNDGRLHIKNEGTGWKYIPMDDPRGERRKVLEAGFENGLTKEFKKSQPKSNGIPGFESKTEFEEFKNSGSTEMVVAEEYQKALKSKDPSVMIALADKLDQQDYDVEYSLGFLPWSNQDKINDIPKMLREEAAKLLNQKQKEKFLANDANNTSTKLTELVKHYESQYQNATDIDQKLKIANDLKTAKLYLQKVKSPEYKKWIGNIKNSNPVTSPTLFGGSGWEGDFAKDELINPYSTRFQDDNNLTWTEVLDFANKNYSLLKGKPYEKTNFLGDKINNPRDVYDAVPYTKNAATQSVNYAKNFTTLNGRRYQLTPDPELGHYIYNEVGDDGSVLPITDPTLYTQLNNKFTTQYGKPVKAIPPVIETPQNWTNELVENKTSIAEIEPVVSAKEQLRSAPVVQRKPIMQQNAPAQNSAPATKYDGGFSDADFDAVFKKFGGQIDEYEEGGIVDSFGHIVKLPNHILKQYEEGTEVTFDSTPSTVTTDPPANTTSTSSTSTVDPNATSKTNPDDNLKSMGEVTINNKKVNAYQQKFTDGTILEVFKDPATGKILSQRALAPGSTATNRMGVNIPIDKNLSRGLTEQASSENLTEAEKQHIARAWKGNTDAYLKYHNTRSALFGDPDFIGKVTNEYKNIVNDPNKGMYTGKNDRTRKYFANKYSGANATDDLTKLGGIDVMSALMEQEERNARLAAFGHDIANSGQKVAGFDPSGRAYANDKNYWHTNAKTLEFIKNNPDLADLDFTKGHRGQAAYIAYMKALQNNPEYQQYSANQIGKNDEGVLGLPSTVSGTEGYSTDTTLGERVDFTGKPKEKPIIPEQPKEQPKEEAKGKWFCVDGQVFQSFDPNVQGEGYATQEDAKANCNAKPESKQQMPQDEYDGWFMPDIVNYATAMGQRTSFTMPTLRQMQAPPSGYDATNPIQKISADQSSSKQIGDQLFNTMDPSTAAAAMLGNRSLENLNAGITGTEQQNLNQSNRAYDSIAGRQMQVDQFNSQFRKAYDNDVATVIDERDRDLNAKDAQLAKLFGTGWWNAARDTGNRVMYPQAKHINRISGKYDGFAGGRDPLAPDTYYSPVSGKSGTTDPYVDAQSSYDRAYQAAIDAGKKPEEATKLAELASKQAYNDYNWYRDKKHGNNPQINYSSGLNTMGAQKYGGPVNFGAHAPDYDFGF